MTRRILTAIIIAVAWLSPAHAQDDSGSPAFEVQSLNTGLGPPPTRLDLSTPRSAMESFVSAVKRTDYAAAAHVLDLDFITEADQARVGPRLAQELSFVLSRKAPIDFGSLPDRPDGMETSGSDRQPMIGVARKSIKLAVLDLPEWPVTIRLNRLAVGDQEPVWVFSRQTVEHIPALYEKYGPTALEEALPTVLKQPTVAGVMLWELVTLPLIAALAVLTALATWKLMGIVAARLPFPAVATAIRRGQLPTALLVIGVILEVMISSIFEFSSATDATLSVIFWILIISALVFGVSRILDTIIDFTSNRYLSNIDSPENTGARRWYTNLSAAKRIGVMFVVVVGLAVALSSLRVFSSFGLSLLVSAGVATAVFGLAAQTVLGNIFASLQLALAKPIRIGDAVFYDDHWAYVEQINYTYVQLRTWDLKCFIVPVKHFISNPFENWTMAEPKMILPVQLKLDHHADVEELRRTFRSMAEEDEDWSEGEEPKVQVIEHDTEAMTVRFYCTADDPTRAWNLHCRMRERLLAHLRDTEPEAVLPHTRFSDVSDTSGDPPAGTSTYDGEKTESGEPKAQRRPGGGSETSGEGEDGDGKGREAAE